MEIKPLPHFRMTMNAKKPMRNCDAGSGGGSLMWRIGMNKNRHSYPPRHQCIRQSTFILRIWSTAPRPAARASSSVPPFHSCRCDPLLFTSCDITVDSHWAEPGPNVSRTLIRLSVTISQSSGLTILWSTLPSFRQASSEIQFYSRVTLCFIPPIYLTTYRVYFTRE